MQCVFCLINILACMVYMLDMAALGTMIKHQGEQHVNMLDITKDDYRKKERRMSRVVKIALTVTTVWSIIKIATLLVILSRGCVSETYCNGQIDKYIARYLIADIIEAALIWLLSIYLFARCLLNMRKYSNFEYKRHRLLTTLNFLGFFVSMPLVMWGKASWLDNWANYWSDRPIYYIVFLSEVLPALTFLFTRPNHDCFNCFNRITPSRYSIFQHSKYDLYA